MGLDTVPARANGQTIDQDWYNLMSRVLSGDLVPRAGGVATSEAGQLGTGVLPFIRAEITSGYWRVGDLKMHHSFNGFVSAGEGWMLCDGRQITQANYDAEHGAGHWVTYVTSSLLLGKFLPDFSTAPGKYPVGVASTTQDGTIAITPVGNASHQVNLSHTHEWYIPDNVDGKTFDVNGAQISIGGQAAHGANYIRGSDGGGNQVSPVGGGYTTATLSTTFNVQPRSIQVMYYMRII